MGESTFKIYKPQLVVKKLRIIKIFHDFLEKADKM